MKSSQIPINTYHPYFKPYIDLVGDSNLQLALKEGFEFTKKFFVQIPENKLEYSYQPGKWTPKDILLHLIDTERVFVFRAMSIARSANVELPGFDENEFAENANAANRSLSNILQEYSAVKKATILFFESLEESDFFKTGSANKNTISILAIGFILCGHEIHHCNIIQERYL